MCFGKTVSAFLFYPPHTPKFLKPTEEISEFSNSEQHSNHPGLPIVTAMQYFSYSLSNTYWEHAMRPDTQRCRAYFKSCICLYSGCREAVCWMNGSYLWVFSSGCCLGKFHAQFYLRFHLQLPRSPPYLPCLLNCLTDTLEAGLIDTKVFEEAEYKMLLHQF